MIVNKTSILKFAIVCGLGTVLAQPAAATTQTTGPASFDTCCWSQVNLGGFTLASHTSLIKSLTSSIDIVDQGWGGQDPTDNQVQLVLFNGSTGLYGVHVAGGTHSWTHQDFAASTADLAGFKSALARINWSTSPTVSLQMWAYPLGYPGWALHGRNATFSASTAVPEAATWAMMLVGFGAIGLAKCRRTVVTKVTFA